MLVKGGAFDAAYQITIPKQMVKDNDEPKNTTNLKKHGISFEEAQTVFA